MFSLIVRYQECLDKYPSWNLIKRVIEQVSDPVWWLVLGGLQIRWNRDIGL